ncbi:hypothetical protein L3X38_026880 [Prunus dulcis]|uniref:Uncharacterized protein n=1 Tax=Prunus dulcis TaxID=3755 RepID=A0AAD4VNC3_PRUDU|nr:hypothetical protein L3X38_026880 [Prunus dulcis]
MISQHHLLLAYKDLNPPNNPGSSNHPSNNPVSSNPPSNNLASSNLSSNNLASSKHALNNLAGSHPPLNNSGSPKRSEVIELDELLANLLQTLDLDERTRPEFPKNRGGSCGLPDITSRDQLRRSTSPHLGIALAPNSLNFRVPMTPKPVNSQKASC